MSSNDPARDKYDDAIEYLTERDPDEIGDAWILPRLHPAGCLFMFAGMHGCACLTAIRSDPLLYCAATPELTDAIAADGRIPKSVNDITVDDLPIFAAWQRDIDLMGVR